MGGKEDNVEIIVGTYEEFLLGYKLVENEEGTYKLEPSFTNHSHSGSVRAVGTVGKYLASGSVDEAIRLINMGLRVEHGYMQQQTGTITCLRNFGSKYLFSGSSDGTICIWKSGSWICEKTLIAHQGGVVDISIHPSGKLALSVGMDKSLKTWNLIKGRTGFVTNIHGNGDVIRWSPDGTYYALGIANRLDVYSVETTKVVYSVAFGKRVSCICFPKKDIVAIAGDKDTVEVHSIKESKKLCEFQAHKVRIKDMHFVDQHGILVTGSNCDQHLKVWRFEKSCSAAPVLIAEIDTTCRITCIAVWSNSILKSHSNLTKPEEQAELETNNYEEDEEDPKPANQTKRKTLLINKKKKLSKSSTEAQLPQSPTKKVKSTTAAKKTKTIQIKNSEPPKKKKKLAKSKT